MRARIRSVKPEILVHEDLWDVEAASELPLFRGFVGLWCYADREGRFKWRPRSLKAGILPHWDGDFEDILDALERAGFVQSYEVEGEQYGLIPNFGKHQHFNGQEPKSTLPGPKKANNKTTRSERAEDASLTRADLEPPVKSDTRASSHVEDVSPSGSEHVEDVPIPSLPFPSLPIGGVGEPQSATFEERCRRLERDRMGAEFEWGPFNTWPDVARLLDAIETITGHRDDPRHGGDPRARAIAQRGAERYLVDQLTEAFEGAMRSEWHSAKRDRHGILTVLRDAAQVDKFREMRNEVPPVVEPEVSFVQLTAREDRYSS